MSNRDEIRQQVGANLAAMPDGIKKAYQSGSQAILNARIDKLTQQAATFTARSWDNLVIYAATHPEDFARNTGQVAGYTSIALAAKRVSLPKVLGNVVQRKVLGAVSANTSTRLVAIARKANVLIRTTDTRFRPLVQKVLTKGKVWRNGAETVAEDETDRLIGLTSETNYTRRARLRMRGNSAVIEAGTPQCFVAGTMIVMADGTLKAIEQIKKGDLVLSRDETTKRNGAKRVTETSFNLATRTTILQAGGERIESTPEHPLYAQGRGFVPAGELGVGTSIVTRAGPALLLQSSRQLSYATRPVRVYNFEVEDFHTYFVGRTGLWVHNGLCVGIWKINPTLRGNLIEDYLAATKYKDWFRVGATKNGFFPLIDFQKGLDVVSLKTVDAKSAGALERMIDHIDALAASNITVAGKRANKILDIRVAPEPGYIGRLSSLIEYGKSNGVTVIISSTP